MGFEEDLKEVIEKARAEKAQEEQEGRSFDTRWEDLRRGMILDVLENAAKVMKDPLGGAQASIDNGGVVLGAVWTSRGKFQHTLKFSPDRDHRVAVYSSSLDGDEPESFSLDNLTESAVEQKVRQFAYIIARGAKQKESKEAILASRA